MAHIETSMLAPAGVRSPPPYMPNVTFALPQVPEMDQIGPLIARHQKYRKFYYGIEVMPRTGEKPVSLNFSSFLPVLPLFVSMAWVGRKNWDVEPISQVESLQLAKHLAPRIPVMPHLTAYRLTDERLDQFLDLNFSNVLILRGDAVEPGQKYQQSEPIVEKAKRRLGSRVSVCVGGFPEGYPLTEVEPPNLDQHIEFLKSKVATGVDCIITQVCYRPTAIIEFVKKVQAAGITVPIMVGIMTHKSFNMYTRIVKLTGAKLPINLLEDLNELQNDTENQPNSDPHLIRQFFVRLNVDIIRRILDANINVFGFQFYTLNNFDAVEATLSELHRLNLFGGKEQEQLNSNLGLIETS